MDADESQFDIVLIGTGLTQSIAAAALSKAGFRVAHIDEKAYYGGDEATLLMHEFVQQFPSSPPLAQARQYSISLAPSVIPSIGPLISSLISSGVARYGGFHMVDQMGIYQAGNLRPVPSSKEDIFTNKQISLLDKRRVMRFLMYTAGDFEGSKELENNEQKPFIDFLRTEFKLNEEMIGAIAYSLAFCSSGSEPTLPVLQRLRRYLRSSGRYGKSPFLVGHYGSLGEISQGFCRAAAVTGAAYILDRKTVSISYTEPRYTIQLSDFPEPISCKVIISNSSAIIPVDLLSRARNIHSTSSFSPHAVARAVAVIDQPLSFDGGPDHDAATSSLDTGVVVFPPFSLPQPQGLEVAVTVLVVGEGTMSTPKGRWILYISAPISSVSPEPDPSALAEKMLRPYLTALLLSATSISDDMPPRDVTPLFTSFYIQHPQQTLASPAETSSESIFITPSLPPNLPLPESPDVAASDAEAVFRAVIKLSEPREAIDQGEMPFWPPLNDHEENE